MRVPRITILIPALLAVSCGGGSVSPETVTPPVSSSPPTPPVKSDFVLNYPGPQVFTVGVAGTSDLPALTDASANRVKVSPPLPVGLQIDANTGVISGTPTAVTPAASYTISVSNDIDGTAVTSVLIEVNEGPFFYSSPAILATGSPMTPLSPRAASSTASYSVTPPLPGGLAIDPDTGVISGTPASAQPATYYQVSRNEPLLTLKFGLTVAVGVSTGPITAADVSTLGCAYSGGFIGTYVGDSQSTNDEGLIAIAFKPDGNALARVLDLSDNAVYDSDGLPGLSANLDGSFNINLLVPPGAASGQIQGSFSGPDLISGIYEVGGVSKPFVASRLGGSATANFRYTGGFGSAGGYRIDFGVLDLTGTQAAGSGYQFGSVGSDYRLINRELAIHGTFDGNTFNWSIPDDAIAGVDTQSNDLELSFGDPYDGLFFAKTLGCRLN